MKTTRGIGVLVALAMALPGRALAAPVGTAFTYQGEVQKNGVGINGACSIRFSLYDALTGGSLVGAPNPNTIAVTATHGLFTATLDFGASAFNGNNARWLEISFEGPGDQSYTTLSPRQPITPAPYAIYAVNGTASTLALPFSGSAALAGDAVAITNTNGGGTGVYGNGGFVGIEGEGTYGGVYGHSASQYGVVGESNSNTSGAIRGHNYANGPGVEGIAGLGNGMNGTSASGNGVYGTTFNSSVPAIYGLNQGGAGTGVQGQSTSGFGVYGNSSSGSGVQGESSTGFGVYGTSAGAAVGVLGVSQGNDGMQALSNAAGKSGIWGNSTSPTGYGGAFSNTGGGVALLVSGLAKVSTLQITGADVAESFPAQGGALEPGTVLEIVGDAAGTLRVSHSSYNTRVAGVVSGANGLPAGVVLEGTDFTNEGKVPVAMSGRVWVKCDATHEAIRVGDLITTSATPGCAMRASDPSRATGAILGKAMTTLERGRGLVLVLVSLQ